MAGQELQRLTQQYQNAVTMYKRAKDDAEATKNGKPLEGAELETALQKIRDAYTASKTAQAALKNYKEKQTTVEAEKNKPQTERQAQLDAAKKGEVYTPATSSTATTGATGDTRIDLSATGSAPTTRDISKEIAAAPKYLYNLPDPTKQAIAAALTTGGYAVPNYKDIETLVGQYQKALSDNQMRNTNFGIKQTLDEFIAAKKLEGGATGGPTVTLSTSISAPTEAASAINTAFNRELGRDATALEIDAYTKKLNTAEKKAATKAVSTKSGNTTSTQYSGGLDKNQFLVTEIQKLPEFSTKKAQKASLTTQSLSDTIRANGLTLPQSQIDQWTKDIQGGTNIDVIKNQIRNIAANGMPDHIKQLLGTGVDLETVYAPYKSTMAAVLEMPATNITLNDPLLRSAIGPDKEMSLYDFQKALRKDSRWQYTNNAKDEVASSVTKVLQDFGFQG
jgi:hypothetical protein